MDLQPRDLTTPDTEPTDEELALVMRAPRALAVQRRAIADAWVAARLKEASIFGAANTQARRTDKVSMTASPASRPLLLVVAGPNGAGKTTVAERGLAHE